MTNNDELERLKFTKAEVSELIGLIHDAWGDGFDSAALMTDHEKLISTLEDGTHKAGEQS